MADNVQVTAGVGTVIHSDEYTHTTLGIGKTQLVKLVDGTIDSDTAIAAGGGLEANALRVTLASDSTGVLSIDDNGGSLTVDNSDLSTLAGVVSGSEMQVDVVTIPETNVNLQDGAGTDLTSTLVGADQSLDVNVTQSAEVAINDGGNTITVDGTVTETNSSAILADTANIDTNVDTIAGAVSGSEMQVDIVTDQPLDRTADNVGVSLQTDAIMNDTTAVTPQYASISAASSGDNTIVAAAGAGNKIRVLSYTIVADGDVDARFEDGAGGTALTGQMALTANSGVHAAFSPVGHFETTTNTLLNLELSAAVGVNGHLTYVVVT